LVSDTQTAYALALHFQLLRELQKRQRAAQRLLELVQAQYYRIGTGFVGTPIVCHALCEVGFEDAAYRLFLQRECPSWLYPVTMGATTVWERWDSLRPDGTVNPGEMTSFNHYALGAVADWLYRVVGGLVPLEPGYRRVLIRPRPGGGLTWAWARHRTPYGMLECRWTIQRETITVCVVIPPNTQGLVVLPQKEEEPKEVGSGEYSWSYPWKEDNCGFLSVDVPLSTIVTSPKARAAVQEVLTAFFPDWVFVTEAVLGQRTKTLREALSGFPEKEKVIEALRETLARLDGIGPQDSV